MGDQRDPDPREAFETLLDTLAVETEHSDKTRLEAFRETLVMLLDDDGRRFDWTAEESRRKWLQDALDAVDLRLAEGD